MDHAPLAVLDGAHNPDACRTLSTLLGRFDYDDLGLVFGAMRDKDHAGNGSGDGDGPGERGQYPWSQGTAVMGIFNLTPDSFQVVAPNAAAVRTARETLHSR